MLSIRLARAGSKKRPFYHIVVANQKSPLGGRYIERLGFYNPLAAGKEVTLQLDEDRLNYWRQQGANMSARVQEIAKNRSKYVAAAAAA